MELSAKRVAQTEEFVAKLTAEMNALRERRAEAAARYACSGSSQGLPPPPPPPPIRSPVLSSPLVHHSWLLAATPTLTT